MPAGSEPAPVKLPRVWRPIGPLIMGTILVVALLVVGGLAWIGFDAETKAAFSALQIATVFFMLALIVAVVYAIGRSRVEAREDGLTVVNGYRRRDLEWAQVVAVHMPPGAPWATFDLSDGTTISGVGILASDGARATRAVRDLRTLLATHS